MQCDICNYTCTCTCMFLHAVVNRGGVQAAIGYSQSDATGVSGSR